MATQLKAPEPVEETDTNVNDNAGEEQQVPRDFDAEARQHGWVPKEEFKGDPSRWVDAETFATRADEVMPLLKKQNEHLKRDLADVKKQARQAIDYFEKDRQRLLRELEGKIEDAVEAGDAKAVQKLRNEERELNASPAKTQYTKEEALDAFDNFRDTNPWYDKGNLGSATELDINARLYADRMTEKHLDKTAEMAPADFFAMIAGLVEEKYPTIRARTPRPKPASDVSGGGQGRNPGPRGKTFNDLPPEAQAKCDKWVKSGLLKDRAAYLASYDWS